MKEIVVRTGTELREVIRAQGESIYTIAKQAGIKPSTLYAAVKSDKRLSFEILIKVARVLPIKLEDIERDFIQKVRKTDAGKFLFNGITVGKLKQMNKIQMFCLGDIIQCMHRMDDTGCKELRDIAKVIMRNNRIKNQ